MDSEQNSPVPYQQVRMDFQGMEQSPMGFNRRKVKQRRNTSNIGTNTSSGTTLDNANFYALLKRQNQMLQMLNQCCMTFQEYEDVLQYHGIKVVSKSSLNDRDNDDSPNKSQTANNSQENTPALITEVRDGFGTALNKHNKQIGFNKKDANPAISKIQRNAREDFFKKRLVVNIQKLQEIVKE